MLGGPAAPLRGQAEGPPEAADGFAADREAFDLTELLGAVTVIELTVGGLDQFPHAIPERALQRPGRGPAPQAMHQPPDALGPIPRREAPELPWGHVEGSGPGAHGNLPGPASCTKPGRRASLRLIVTVSHGSMGGHFYRAVRGGHFYSAARHEAHEGWRDAGLHDARAARGLYQSVTKETG